MQISNTNRHFFTFYYILLNDQDIEKFELSVCGGSFSSFHSDFTKNNYNLS
jgi:hypothetical protein